MKQKKLCMQNWKHLKFSPAEVRKDKNFVFNVLESQAISLEEAILHFSSPGPNCDILLAKYLFDELQSELSPAAEDNVSQ